MLLASYLSSGCHSSRDYESIVAQLIGCELLAIPVTAPFRIANSGMSTEEAGLYSVYHRALLQTIIVELVRWIYGRQRMRRKRRSWRKQSFPS